MAKLKGLGRGLDALLAGDMASVGEADSLLMLKVEQLQPANINHAVIWMKLR